MIVTRTDSTSTYDPSQNNPNDTSRTTIYVGDCTGYGYAGTGKIVSCLKLLIEPTRCESATNLLCNIGMSIWEELHLENLEQIRAAALLTRKWFMIFLGLLCTAVEIPKFSLSTPDKGSGLLTHCGYI